MIKKGFLTIILAALALSSSIAFAEDMEKCMIGDKEFDVPAGQCEKLKAGDFSGVSEEIKATIEGTHAH